MARRIVAVMADSHGGHKLGLCNPQVKLPEEDEKGKTYWYTPTLTNVQRWLWKCYEEDMKKVVNLAAGDPITLIHNGDITWGRKHPEGTISTRDVDQYIIAESNLLPWFMLSNLTSVRIMHGTQSHEYGEGSAPLVVSRALSHMGRSVKACRHGLYNMDGVRLDVAHHGPSLGSRHWLTGNVLVRTVRSIMLDALERGKPFPDVVLRAHNHGLVWQTVRYCGAVCEAIAIPSYCGLTHYAAQVTRQAYLLTCGLVALVIEDGSLSDVFPYKREVDLRTEEEL